MLRTTFLVSLAASTTLPGTSASPGPAVTPDSAAPKCDTNPYLPYDKRLEFSDTALDGPNFDLVRYRGYAVWISIFATWCGPCRDEQALVVSTATKFRDKGVRTIGLFAREWDDNVRAYRKNTASSIRSCATTTAL